MRIVHSKLYNKEIKKNVEKEIDSIVKESGITRKEFDEIKCIVLEMKVTAQKKIVERNFHCSYKTFRGFDNNTTMCASTN